MLMSDMGYQKKVYSDIRYNVGLCDLQSNIGRSDIRLSPISLITDIGLSAHLWWFANQVASVGNRDREGLLSMSGVTRV
jgi:hypothetical protein